MKVCTICNKDFENGHGKRCNSCAWKLKIEKKKLTTVENPREYAIITGNVPEKCNRCDKIFNETEFKFDIQMLRYRNPCNECYNKAKYYEVYRAMKRETDYQEFTEHSREIHKQWIERNKEYMKNYNRDYNQTPKRKIENIISTAKRGGNIDLNKIEEIKSIITDLVYKPCFYCGFQDDNLNGIDRVNSNIDYIVDNIVPCCIMCNFMKNTLDIATFISHITKIVKYNFDDTIQLFEFGSTDYQETSTTDYWSYMKRAETKRIEFTITRDYFEKLTIKTECNYCKFTGSNSSFISYETL
jgi:hypothetical protein